MPFQVRFGRADTEQGKLHRYRLLTCRASLRQAVGTSLRSSDSFFLVTARLFHFRLSLGMVYKRIHLRMASPCRLGFGSETEPGT